MPVQRLGRKRSDTARGSRRTGAGPRARGTTGLRARRAAARPMRRARAAPEPAASPAHAPVPADPQRLNHPALRAGPGRKARGPVRVETEEHRLVGPQVGELPRLRQRDSKLAARAALLEQHRRVRAVEQHALHAPAWRGCPSGSSRSLRPRLATSGRTNASTASPAAIAPSLRARMTQPSAVVISTDARRRCALARPTMRLFAPTKPATKGVRGPVIQVLRRAELLEAPLVHHAT